MRRQLSDSAIAWILRIGLITFCILVIAAPLISSAVAFHHAIDLLQSGEYEKAADLFEKELPAGSSFCIRRPSVSYLYFGEKTRTI